MRRNDWNNSRKLQGLFLTLSFSRQNLEEKNTGINRPFLWVETIIWWGNIGVCPEENGYLFWVCLCPEGEFSRGCWVICKDKIRRKKTLCSTPKCTAQGLKFLDFLGRSQAAESCLFRAVRGCVRFPITLSRIISREKRSAMSRRGSRPPRWRRRRPGSAWRPAGGRGWW